MEHFTSAHTNALQRRPHELELHDLELFELCRRVQKSLLMQELKKIRQRASETGGALNVIASERNIYLPQLP